MVILFLFSTPEVTFYITLLWLVLQKYYRGFPAIASAGACTVTAIDDIITRLCYVQIERCLNSSICELAVDCYPDNKNDDIDTYSPDC